MRVQFRFFGCGHPVLPTLFVEDWWEFLKASKLTSGLHIHLLISNLTVWEYTKIKPGSSQGLLHTKYCPWKSSRDQLEISVLKNKDHRETQGQRVKDKTTQSDEEVTMKIMTSITSGSQINIRQTDNICLYRQSRGATVCLHGVQPAFHKGPCSLEPIFLCFHISSHFHYKRVGTSGKKKDWFPWWVISGSLVNTDALSLLQKAVPFAPSVISKYLALLLFRVFWHKGVLNKRFYCY